MITREQFALDVAAEMLKQDEKWGPQWHSTTKWLTILGEEFGEACQAALDNDLPHLYEELVQVAAVVHQMGTRLW